MLSPLSILYSCVSQPFIQRTIRIVNKTTQSVHFHLIKINEVIDLPEDFPMIVVVVLSVSNRCFYPPKYNLNACQVYDLLPLLVMKWNNWQSSGQSLSVVHDESYQNRLNLKSLTCLEMVRICCSKNNRKERSEISPFILMSQPRIEGRQSNNSVT